MPTNTTSQQGNQDALAQRQVSRSPHEQAQQRDATRGAASTDRVAQPTSGRGFDGSQEGVLTPVNAKSSGEDNELQDEDKDDDASNQVTGRYPSQREP